MDRAVFAAVLASMVSLPFVLASDLKLGIVLSVAVYSTLSAIAAVLALRSALRGDDGERRPWAAFALGLASWTSSGVLVLAFFASGGDPLDLPAWTQGGYLLAYPFFFIALWSLRQPGAAESLRQRVLTASTEMVVLLLVGIVMVSLLWYDGVAADLNISLLIPPTLDVLLFGLFYNAVRRTGIAARGALAWLGYAFGALMVTDVLATFTIVRGWEFAFALILPGYSLCAGLQLLATRRRLRISEAQRGLLVSHVSVVVVGVLLAGAAVAILPGQLKVIGVLTGAFLAWRVFAAIREAGSDDLDVGSGFLSSPAFSRQLQRAIGSGQELTLIGVDLNGFGVWNARNGFSAGDEMLGRVAQSLDASFSAGVWGRIGPDRYAHLGPSPNLSEDRNTADQLRRRAAAAAQELSARAGIVRLPHDAESAEEALAVLDETLQAAREAEREVVAYGSGALDGIEMMGQTTLADRRARIQALIDSPEAIKPVFQPIVRMVDSEILSFEGLSRFHATPNRGPDVWIAEAHAAGLGVDVELECVRRVVEKARTSPIPVHVSVNASPALVFSRGFAVALGDGDLSWLTIEITEHDEVENYAKLAEQLSHFRGRGAAVAVDDAGAGHSSLRHVMQLRPEWIKLDRSLIQEIDNDPGKRALVRSMVAFNEEIGSHLIAEGVETKAEMDTLLHLGVEMAQGYFFARPESEFVEAIPPPWELATS